MGIFTVMGVALVGTAATLLLKSYKPEFAMACAIITAVTILALSIVDIRAIVNFMDALSGRTGIASPVMTVLLKSLGIAYVAQLGADICRDSGQEAAASKVELAGKLSILIIALPLFESMINMIANLLA